MTDDPAKGPATVDEIVARWAETTKPAAAEAIALHGLGRGMPHVERSAARAIRGALGDLVELAVVKLEAERNNERERVSDPSNLAEDHYGNGLIDGLGRAVDLLRSLVAAPAADKETP